MREKTPPKAPDPSRTASLAELKAALGDLLTPARRPLPENDCGLRAREKRENTPTQKNATDEKRALEKLFPHGLPPGELIEVLHRGSGSGALALCLARTASQDGRAIAVIDPSAQFYPHPAVALGIAPQQLIILRPNRDTEAMWTLEQAVRCRGFAAVIWRAERPALRHLRRLQHACAQYDTLGLLLRAQTIGPQPTAARTRLRVRAIDAGHRASTFVDGQRDHFSLFSRQRLRVERLRGAHLTAGNRIELEIDYASGTLRQAAPLPLAS